MRREGQVTLADLPIRDDLRGRSPYGAPQIDVPVRLNTNENPYPPSPGLVDDLAAAVRRDGSQLNRYPDRDAVALREDLAAYLGHGLSVDHVWAANGSNEVIQQILQAFGGHGRTALGFEPSYSMHPIITAGASTRWVAAAREDDFGLDPERAVAAIERHRPDIVFLTSPNNPTGTALPLEVIERVVKTAPGMVVVDEAYFEFARTGTPSALTLLPGAPRLIVTRTMSKAFAMAGTRLGYLAADPAVVQALLLVRLPYHLSSLTQAAARVALAHRGELLGTVDRLRAERDGCAGWLTARGLSVAGSDANFVMFGRFADRRAVWEALLERGVLIREVGPPQWLRVSIGTTEEMAAFRAAMAAVLDVPDALAVPVTSAGRMAPSRVTPAPGGSARDELEELR